MKPHLLFAALGLTALARCASAPSAARDSPGCEGLTPPTRLTKAPVALPASFTATRVGGEVDDEVVIGADGAVRSVRLVHTRYEGLAPFGEKSVRDSRFDPGRIEGNPVAVRVLVSTLVGMKTKAREEPPYFSVWANVPGGESREARWQLRDSVERITLSAHLGAPLPGGGEIVALAGDGREKVLLKLPASAAAEDLRRTVSTGKFFARAGDYRIEIRSGGKTLGSTTVTIAEDFKAAIVNACAPI